MLIALGVEGVYLGTLASSRRFQRAVRARGGAGGGEARETLEALRAELAPSQREHYEQLAGLKERILANYRRLPGGRVLAASSEPRLDTLLTSFLRLVATLNQYRAFLGAADRQAVQGELEALEADVAREESARLREVKARRVDILRKRLERFRQAQESREVVSHQLASIEDLLRLTHEQSIAIRDPDTVNRQLATLAIEAEASEESVRQLERFMDFSEEAEGSLPHGTRVR